MEDILLSKIEAAKQILEAEKVLIKEFRDSDQKDENLYRFVNICLDKLNEAYEKIIG